MVKVAALLLALPLGAPVRRPALAPKAAVGAALARRLPLPDQAPRKGLDEKSLEALRQAAELLARRHVSGPAPETLLAGALRGMAGALDRHTQYLDPETFQAYKEKREGLQAGVGLVAAPGPDEVLVVAYTLPGSPAESAGLRPGDRILAADGTPPAASGLPRGRPGTTLALRIQRGAAVFDLALTRALVPTPNLRAELMPGGAGYVHFAGFQDQTGREVVEAIRRLRAQGASSLILDVRFNPGGRVSAVAEIASAFLAQGEVVQTSREGDGQEVSLRAAKDGEFLGMPVTVLVNRFSASASEALAGALQDHRRATVIGSRTRGKGSAQQVYPLPSGGALKVTTKSWFTPSGRSVNGTGLEPDVAVDVPEEQEKALHADLLMRLAGRPGSGVPDPVLEKALGR